MIVATAKAAVMIRKTTTPRHSGVMMSVAAGMAADHSRCRAIRWPGGHGVSARRGGLPAVRYQRAARDGRTYLLTVINAPGVGARHTEHRNATRGAPGPDTPGAEWVRRCCGRTS